MERITVNLEDGVAGVLTTKAKSQNHSASGYVELLIKADLRAAGLLPRAGDEDDAEFIKAVTDVVRKNPAVKPLIAGILRKHEGKRRVAAAAAASR